jgi:hypothetical protein
MMKKGIGLGRCYFFVVQKDYYQAYIIFKWGRWFMKYTNGMCAAILACLFMNVQLCSMHNNYQNNLFIILPIDVLNYIASFVQWEAYKDFIERTAIIKEIPFEVIKDKYFDTMVSPCRETQIVHVLSPDERKRALMDMYCDDCKGAEIVIAHAEEGGMIFKDTVEKVRCINIAVSTTGNRVAMIEKKEHRDEITKVLSYSYIVAVRKIIGDKFDKKSKEYDIPGYMTPEILAFNRQGTHLIIHGVNVQKPQEDNKIHHVYLLKTDATYCPEVTVDNKANMLLEYFQHNRVCKSIWQK